MPSTIRGLIVAVLMIAIAMLLVGVLAEVLQEARTSDHGAERLL